MVKKIILLFSVLILKVSAQTDTNRVVINNTEVVFCAVVPLQDHVVISWTTSKEGNNAYFTLEKSKDGKKFSKIIDVPGSGDGKSYREYVETDYQPYKETSYYRIKQIDYNGGYTYFPTTGVVFNPAKTGKFYPNQAQVQKSVKQPDGIKNDEVLVVLQDAEGVEFSTKVTITQEDSQLFATDSSRMIPPGIYIIISSSDENIYSQKIIVK